MLSPSDGGFDYMFWIEGRPSLPGQGLAADIRRVDSGYFAAMRIPIVQGRAIAEQDRLDAPDVTVISATMAAHYWPHENAIGKRLGVMFGRPNPHPTIVGVAGDVHGALDDRPRDIIYLPYPQGRHVTDMYLVMRPRAGAAIDSGRLAAMVRAAAAAVDPNQPVYRVRTMEELMAASVAARYFEVLLLAVFAAAAMSLAAVGLYGVLAYAVQVRTREIGIRTALGASPRQMFRMVLADACRLAAIGVALGWVGALALTRSLAALLFEVKPGDQAAYVTVGALLFAASIVATYAPARRAMRVEPVVALRSE
jgi:putative ABC transport system permease protein